MASNVKILFSLIMVLSANQALALGLGEIDLRSYLGQPLDARIPVLAGPDEPLEESCFKLANGAITSDTGHATPAKLSFQQIGRNNILQIRSSSSVPEPAVRIQIEVSCGNVSRISREYTLLLDPPEYAASRISLPSKPTAPAPVASSAEPLSAVPATPMAISQPTAGQVSSSAAMGEVIAAPAPTTGMPKAKTPRKPKRAPSADTAPVAPPPARVAPPRPAAKIAPAYKPSAEAAAPEEKIAPPAPIASISKNEKNDDGFRLKLSSVEMNLSLTKSVTETDRQRLRARQLLLETQSDDQTATILSMKNSIKQMEAQLAELRRQMAAQKGAPIGNVVGMPDLSVTPAATAPPAPPEMVTPEPSKAPVVSIPAAKPLPAKTPPAESAGFSLAGWVLPALIASAGALLLIVGVNIWRRRGNKNMAYKDLYADADANIKVPEQSVGQFDENKLFEDAKDDADLEEILLSEPATEPPPVQAAARPPLDLSVSPTLVSDPRTIVDVQAPDSFKMAYLRQRFPEIAQGSLQLDKPDSLIHAARLYYQEDNNSAKAAELLEYAIGEYPNEVRPWLAVFEIYRLENRKTDFANLAQRFKEKFEHGGYWPKVQAIGRQIDAENPLYVAQEFDTQHEQVENISISSEAENWLNAPLDFTQDLLGNELRSALMSDDADVGETNVSSNTTTKPGELTLSPQGKKPV